MDARKRRAEDAAEVSFDEDASNSAEITPLGAGNEVGRSCIIFKYQGKTIMFDCGIHPGYSGLSSLPYLDEVDLTTVDVALITHFHLDHCAAVPYLLTKTRFKGRIFMTHPTKVIYNSLLRDFARLNKGSAPDEQLYSEEDIDASMDKIEVVDFQQTLEITPYRAGHVLGAAMFMVEIAGMRCLYTGDYSRVPDRHLPVIIEATYGVSRHLPREERERHFLNTIHTTVAKQGKVLLPVVALGRAQELLLMLDEYWDKTPQLQKVPIYQASGMMRKAMTVYQTYDHNPFDFRHVTHLNTTKQFDDIGPCVMMATPSGLQSGVSRDVFDAWCDDPRNAVVLCDFAVQKPLRAQVAHISFSAHADFDQTSSFLDSVQPPHIVLVHGEVTEMGRLKNALERGAQALNIDRNVFMPRNNQTVMIEHKPLRVVRLMGRLAEKPPAEGQAARGVLVSVGGTSTASTQLLHPDDLPAYTKLYKGRVTQRQAIQISKSFADIRLALEVMFEGVGGDGTHPVQRSGSASPQREKDKDSRGKGKEPELLEDTIYHAMPCHGNPTPKRLKNTITHAEKDKDSRGKGKEPELLEDAMSFHATPCHAMPCQSNSDTNNHNNPHAEKDKDSRGKGKESELLEDAMSVTVGDHVTVTYHPANASTGLAAHVLVEWEGGKIGDMVADAVVAVLLQ
eukprot:gene1513-32891_t